jgi:hypothetical protein
MAIDYNKFARKIANDAGKLARKAVDAGSSLAKTATDPETIGGIKETLKSVGHEFSKGLNDNDADKSVKDDSKGGEQ